MTSWKKKKRDITFPIPIPCLALTLFVIVVRRRCSRTAAEPADKTRQNNWVIRPSAAYFKLQFAVNQIYARWCISHWVSSIQHHHHLVIYLFRSKQTIQLRHEHWAGQPDQDMAEMWRSKSLQSVPWKHKNQSDYRGVYLTVSDDVEGRC